MEKLTAGYQPLTEAVAQDYPAAEITVSFPDRWQLVTRLHREQQSLYVAGFPPSPEPARSDHFFGLSDEINRSLDTYRLYKLFEPRPVHHLTIAWDRRVGAGQVIDGADVGVQLLPVGQAQAWTGEEAGVLWEAFTHQAQRRTDDWQADLRQFWQAVERDLGVQRIFTQPHEPTIAEEEYMAFLGHLGYGPDPNFDRWWAKEYPRDGHPIGPG